MAPTFKMLLLFIFYSNKNVSGNMGIASIYRFYEVRNQLLVIKLHVQIPVPFTNCLP